MKYIIDHDMHIHSFLSRCSKDETQTPEAILDYGRKNGLRRICLTNHYWDSAVPGASEWYSKQNFEHISIALPLPQADDCRFLFGCETDMDKNFRIGLPKERFDDFDFIIVPTTHLHMKGFTYEPEQDNVQDKTKLFLKRFEAFLSAELPFKKVGLAHITTSLIHRQNHISVLRSISDSEFEGLFKECAKLGCGIELNIALKTLSDSENLPHILRPYIIAKEQGCRFYLGSDAHTAEECGRAEKRFKAIIDALKLEEKDKYKIEP